MYAQRILISFTGTKSQKFFQSKLSFLVLRIGAGAKFGLQVICGICPLNLKNLRISRELQRWSQ